MPSRFVHVFAFSVIVFSCAENTEEKSVQLLWSSGKLEITEKSETIVSRADELLNDGPYSVLQKSFTPPSGDKHDYMSMGVYWWPNPDTEDGLPYIRKDGFVNPEVHEITDKGYLNKTTEIAFMSGLAYQITGDEKYASKAAEVLISWFINDSTRMNPNLDFGQGVPGRAEGRCYGIIETRSISKVLDAESLIADSPHWSEENSIALKAWFKDYMYWLLESELGMEEFTRLNNHGTWYDVQVISIALGVNEPDHAEHILMHSKKRMLDHVDSIGRQPLELARTRSWDYSVMNLRSMILLGVLGEKAGINLWQVPDENDPAIRRALDYLIPFASSPDEWKYEQVKDFSTNGLIPLIREAQKHYPEHKKKYEETLEKLGTPDQDFMGLYDLD